MFTPEMIAPCGLDCSLCSRTQAERDPCPGCRGPNRNKPAFCAERCGIILCEKRKGNGYVYCDECPDFPCGDVMEKENRYTSQYPLYESPLENLRSVRALGMEEFLRREREKWTCSECGAPVSVHTGVCSGCGKHYGARPVQIDGATWRVENGGVRFFVLAGEEKALLIDSGMTVPHARRIASFLTGLPVSLLNTHSDGDHTGGNGLFESFYMHPAEEEAYRQQGGGGTLLPIQAGDTLDLGNRRLRIIALPGHTPGSVAVLDEGRRVLISGDPIQMHGRIFMFGQHRNMPLYIASLERLEERMGEFDRIWPSHGDFPLGPEVIPRLREGARRILDGGVPGKEETVFGQTIRAYDLGFTTILWDGQR